MLACDDILQQGHGFNLQKNYFWLAVRNARLHYCKDRQGNMGNRPNFTKLPLARLHYSSYIKAVVNRNPVMTDFRV